jgi:hypothetical protein
MYRQWKLVHDSRCLICRQFEFHVLTLQACRSWCSGAFAKRARDVRLRPTSTEGVNVMHTKCKDLKKTCILENNAEKWISETKKEKANSRVQAFITDMCMLNPSNSVSFSIQAVKAKKMRLKKLTWKKGHRLAFTSSLICGCISHWEKKNADNKKEFVFTLVFNNSVLVCKFWCNRAN